MILSINALSWFSDTLYFDSFYLIIFMFFFFSYKYEFCPFHNVTQREQTARWNAFAGILG